MTADEILAQYPKARTVVSWCEMFMSPNEFDGRDLWAGFSDPDEALKFIQGAIAEEPVTDMPMETRLLARTQTETDDFRRYLSAKLGMM